MHRRRSAPSMLLPAAASLLVSAPLAAQSVESTGSVESTESVGRPVPVDTSGLGAGPRARLHVLLERTILGVDVLTLDVRLGAAETARLAALLDREAAPGRGADPDALADSVAAVALAARDALARMEFHRNVGRERFLDGIRDNLRSAVRAGIITVDQYRSIARGLPTWYAFLTDRGVRAGDRLVQRIRGDSLRTVYVGVDGRKLLDQVDVGPHRRLAVLGGYFAPGSEFRDGLVDSALAAREVREPDPRDADGQNENRRGAD